MSNVTHRPKTRAEQREATRAHLLRVGRRIFTRHGYDATSVAMLCRAARVTHGALYHHFPSMLDLFVAVTNEIANEVAARVQHAADATVGWAQVEAACAAYLEACGEADVAAIFLRDAPRVIPAAVFSELDDAANAPVVFGLLQRWIDEGLMRPFSVEIVGRLLGAAFAEAGALIVAAEKPDEARRAVSDTMLAWVATLRTS
jgi:AcrR family transcriptional regulator